MIRYKFLVVRTLSTPVLFLSLAWVLTHVVIICRLSDSKREAKGKAAAQAST